jgi:O-acetyl-ADP-ribose deacetylase (regulator of RNase III)
MITIHGNIFDHFMPEDVMVHGCNAQGVMGSGIAAQVRELFPAAYEVYRRVFEQSGLDLGEVIYHVTDDRKVIANAITQQFFGSDPRTRYASYDAIDDAFKNIFDMCAKFDVKGKVLIPKIGAGLGNAHWGAITEIIDHRASPYDIPVFYDEYQK